MISINRRTLRTTRQSHQQTMLIRRFVLISKKFVYLYENQIQFDNTYRIIRKYASINLFNCPAFKIFCTNFPLVENGHIFVVGSFVFTAFNFHLRVLAVSQSIKQPLKLKLPKQIKCSSSFPAFHSTELGCILAADSSFGVCSVVSP